jgi:hypothetical protein
VIQVRKNLSTPAVIGIACHLIPEIHSSVESPSFILPRNDRGGGKSGGIAQQHSIDERHNQAELRPKNRQSSVRFAMNLNIGKISRVTLGITTK